MKTERTKEILKRVEKEIKEALKAEGVLANWMKQNVQENYNFSATSFLLRLYTPSGFSNMKINLLNGKLEARSGKEESVLKMDAEVISALRKYLNPLWQE